MVCICSLVERLDLRPSAVLLMSGGKLPARWANSAHARRAFTTCFITGLYTDIHSLYEAAQRIRTTGVNGVLIGRASFGNPWLFQKRQQLKQLLHAGVNPTHEDLPDVMPTREERLHLALEHARVHAKLKGEDYFVELRKHMGWYLGHFPGAKQVRNALVRINSLSDVEQIIQQALDNPRNCGDEG